MLSFVAGWRSTLIMFACGVALGGSLAGCSSASPAETLATAINEQAVKLDTDTVSITHDFQTVETPDSGIHGTRTHPGTIQLKNADNSWKTIDGVEGYELKSPDGYVSSNTIIVVDGDKCTSLKGDRGKDAVVVTELPSCPESNFH